MSYEKATLSVVRKRAHLNIWWSFNTSIPGPSSVFLDLEELSILEVNVVFDPEILICNQSAAWKDNNWLNFNLCLLGSKQ
jgi:hypothetical protein